MSFPAPIAPRLSPAPDVASPAWLARLPAVLPPLEHHPPRRLGDAGAPFGGSGPRRQSAVHPATVIAAVARLRVPHRRRQASVAVPAARAALRPRAPGGTVQLLVQEFTFPDWSWAEYPTTVVPSGYEPAGGPVTVAEVHSGPSCRGWTCRARLRRLPSRGRPLYMLLSRTRRCRSRSESTP